MPLVLREMISVLKDPELALCIIRVSTEVLKRVCAIISEESNRKSKIQRNVEMEEAFNVIFMCNICRERPWMPIATLCGHVYCWMCIKKWYEMRERWNFCPVCRKPNDIFDVIPIYARGTTMNYGGEGALADEEYRETLAEYEHLQGDLIRSGTVQPKRFLSFVKPNQTQFRNFWCVLGILFVYYWVSNYK